MMEVKDPKTGNVITTYASPDMVKKYMPELKVISAEVCCNIGSDICSHYKKCVQLAKDLDCRIWFIGNGIKFIADKNSPEDLVDRFLDDCYSYDVKELGPGELVLDE